MYIILARGRGLQGLDSIRGAQELTVGEDDERIFVVRRELKKD